MNDTIKRLSALKHSLEGARDTKHPIPMRLIDAMNMGLQIAIDAIDRELETIAAGQAGTAPITQPPAAPARTREQEMSKTNNGGPAFPVPGLQQYEEFNGMTLRDYFAAKAMEGMLSDPGFDPKAEDAAQRAYQMADAMLAERAK